MTNFRINIFNAEMLPRPLLGVVLLCSVIFMPAAVSAQTVEGDPSQLFQQANIFYRDGKHSEAAGIYRKLAQEFPDNPAFAFNLGNSLFRLNQLGESILAYEKAKIAAPRNEDIRRNLNYVKGHVAYRVEDKRNWYIQAGEKVLEHFREKEIYFLVLAAFFVFALGWVLHLYRKQDLSWGPIRKIAGTLFLILLVLALFKSIESSVMRDAVILAKEPEVRYGPSISDQVAFRVGEGVKVYVVDEREEWSRILLVNGESGWIRNSQIAKVEDRFPNSTSEPKK